MKIRVKRSTVFMTGCLVCYSVITIATATRCSCVLCRKRSLSSAQRLAPPQCGLRTTHLGATLGAHYNVSYNHQRCTVLLCSAVMFGFVQIFNGQATFDRGRGCACYTRVIHSPSAQHCTTRCHTCGVRATLLHLLVHLGLIPLLCLL